MCSRSSHLTMLGSNFASSPQLTPDQMRAEAGKFCCTAYPAINNMCSSIKLMMIPLFSRVSSDIAFIDALNCCLGSSSDSNDTSIYNDRNASYPQLTNLRTIQLCIYTNPMSFHPMNNRLHVLLLFQYLFSPSESSRNVPHLFAHVTHSFL